METRVAVISIIVENPEATEQLNQYLHEAGKYIIGRIKGVSAKTAYSNVITKSEEMSC